MMRKLCFLLVMFAMVGGVLRQPMAQAQDETDSETILVWVDWNVPSEFEIMLQPLFDQDRYERTYNQEEAVLSVQITDGDSAINSEWLYVPVMAFPTTTADSLSYVDLQRYWSGDSLALNSLADNGRPMTLLVTDNTFDAIQGFLGEPAPNVPIRRLPGDAIVNELWEEHPNTWTLMPFHELTPEVKVLSLDGTDVFNPDSDLSSYPLKLNIGMVGDGGAVGEAIDVLLAAETWRGSNRNVESLTRIVLSGVTALSRATAYAMENNGILIPAEGVLDFVADADIFHTSNEVSFSENCPYPDPNAGTLFCSDARYMELFEHLGLDVIELTGNHVNDYGTGALNYTLDIYEEANLDYFGGGRNAEAARQPLILESNGNSIAFIGCNFYDIDQQYYRALAGEEKAGAAACDFEFLETELNRLSEEVDIVIMTVQDYEFYSYVATDAQKERMAQFINWGADVVIGSQAHQPHGFDLVQRDGQNAGFVHHGLGNLFFDQMADLGTRQMFMDRVIVHEGQVIGVELYTGLIENYCCPRPMTADERQDFLNTIFGENGW